MTRSTARSLTAGISALAFLTAAAPALAQEGGTSVRELTDVITVTATKSADPENVQDVPVAITAFNAASLDALNVRDLEDLTFSAPNVVLDDIGTFRGQASFSIRGLGVNSSITSVDPAVGVFVDGVYQGVNAGVVFDLFDLESIEVLRGPQGTLFGRNTTGGAVLINTADPTDTFEGKVTYIAETPVDEGRGGINQYMMGTISGPLLPGKLNGKLSAYVNDDQGYFENQFDGSDLGAAETQIIRGALEWTPLDALRVLAKAELFENDGDGAPGQNRGLFRRDSFDISINEPGSINFEAQSYSLRADWDLGFGTLTNITGYRNLEQRTLNDIDSTPGDLFFSPTRIVQDQISNELRFAGTFGAFDVKTGLFYFRQDIGVDEERIVPISAASYRVGGGVQQQDVFGLFGQVDYQATETLTLTGGLRLGYEEKDVTVAYVRAQSAPCSVINGTCATDDILTNGFSDDDAWQNLSPKLGFQWQPAPNAQVYGGWTRAFRSGGYNFRISDIAGFVDLVQLQTEIATDEEQVDSFELGTKFQTADNRAQINAAVFFTDIADMQREVNISDDTTIITQQITNTADASIYGVEVEGRFTVTDNLLLLGNIGWLEAAYDEVRYDISTDGVIDGEDLDLAIPRVPELTYGASLIWDASLGEAGDLATRLSFQHRDEQAYTDNNFGWIQEADMLDLNVTWATPYEGLSLSVYGENLLDEVQAGGDTQLPFGGPLSTGVNEPFAFFPAGGTFSPLKKGRLVGFEATYTF